MEKKLLQPAIIVQAWPAGSDDFSNQVSWMLVCRQHFSLDLDQQSRDILTEAAAVNAAQYLANPACMKLRESM